MWFTPQHFKWKYIDVFKLEHIVRLQSADKCSPCPEMSTATVSLSCTWHGVGGSTCHFRTSTWNIPNCLFFSKQMQSVPKMVCLFYVFVTYAGIRPNNTNIHIVCVVYSNWNSMYAPSLTLIFTEFFCSFL